uniref:Ovule protein n=1 Tax=Macrostomum lignano TaxID=282301 RepID=A0A1I8FHJ7_9PLAT
SNFLQSADNQQGRPLRPLHLGINAKQGPCLNRPPNIGMQRKTAVKAYTLCISDESQYLQISTVCRPSV